MRHVVTPLREDSRPKNSVAECRTGVCGCQTNFLAMIRQGNHNIEKWKFSRNIEINAPYVYVISDPVRLTFCQTRWCFTFCLTWAGVLWWPWPEPASDFGPSLTTKPFGPEWTWPTNGSVLGWWGQSFPGEHRSLGWPRLVSNLPSFSHPLFCSTGT